jgi:hypothetical protein
MSSKLTARVALLLAMLAVLPTGCRSAKSTLPPDQVLAQYAPREGFQAGAEYTAMQSRDLAASAPAVANGKADSWRGSSPVASRGGGSSGCTSGCCSH